MATPPAFGVYTPLVTFFAEDESLDLESTLTHAQRMAESEVRGLVLMGSNGEAPHLNHSERQSLVRAVRDHLDHLGYTELQLIVGCGAPSVRETLSYISEAKASGANYALVLPPAYWVAAMNASVIETFFHEVSLFDFLGRKDLSVISWSNSGFKPRSHLNPSFPFSFTTSPA